MFTGGRWFKSIFGLKHMKETVLTWKECYSVIRQDLVSDSKDVSVLINMSRQNGIGVPVSFQKTRYNENDLKKLTIIVNWWAYLNENSNVEWRDGKTTKLILDRVIKSVLTGKQIVIFAIFCPSYKVGENVFGYEMVIGSHSKKLIRSFSDFIINSEKCGINIKGMVYFSDIMLENFPKLKGTSYREDLESCYKSFGEEFERICPGKIVINKLSSVEECSNEIGEEGINTGLNIDKKIFGRILLRNAVFYKEKMKWDDDSIYKRTVDLVCGYLKLSDIFSKKFPDGIMYWVESAYERGLVYGVNEDSIIPIIFPKKNE